MKFKTENVELTTDEAKIIYGMLSDVPWEAASQDFLSVSMDLLFKIKGLLPKRDYDKLIKDAVERAR